MDKIKVLFVCLGNICRSPMAEGLFIHLIESEGIADSFEVDSAGTSAYHAGDLADKRMRNTAASQGIALTTRSRQVLKQDLSEFDYVLAMDRTNLSNIKALQTPGANYRAKIVLMREYDSASDPERGRDMDVPDPYYGGDNGFQEVYDILLRSNQKFLEEIRQTHAI
jgi:protein-tyrosine phosphatase